MQNTHDSLDILIRNAGCGDWPASRMTSKTWVSVRPKIGSESDQERPAREFRWLRFQES